MAQGFSKKAAKAKPAKSAGKRQVGISKPKPAKKTAANKLHRKFTAGLIAKTERSLAEKAGRTKFVGKVSKGEKVKKQMGGSKKFG